MVLDILKHHAVVDFSASFEKVTSAPDMPSLIAFLQVRVCLLHLVGRAAFHAPDHVTDRKLGWDRHHHMHVIIGDDPFEKVVLQTLHQ